MWRVSGDNFRVSSTLPPPCGPRDDRRSSGLAPSTFFCPQGQSQPLLPYFKFPIMNISNSVITKINRMLMLFEILQPKLRSLFQLLDLHKRLLSVARCCRGAELGHREWAWLCSAPRDFWGICFPRLQFAALWVWWSQDLEGMNRYTPASMGQIRNLTIASVDENAEQLERPGTIGGKRSTNLENCWTFQMTDAGCRSTQSGD